VQLHALGISRRSVGEAARKQGSDTDKNTEDNRKSEKRAARKRYKGLLGQEKEKVNRNAHGKREGRRFSVGQFFNERVMTSKKTKQKKERGGGAKGGRGLRLFRGVGGRASLFPLASASPAGERRKIVGDPRRRGTSQLEIVATGFSEGSPGRGCLLVGRCEFNARRMEHRGAGL